MKLSAAGLFLLVLGFIGLSGFLTGNLDRWLASLFSAGTAAPATTSGVSTTLPTVGRQTTGAIA